VILRPQVPALASKIDAEAESDDRCALGSKRPVVRCKKERPAGEHRSGESLPC
jgi:hypothetical protein